MPNQPTQEQLQRHQEQLEAGLQRSLDLATAQVAAQNAQAVQNDSLPFFLTSAPYLQGRPQDAEPLTGEVREETRSERKKRESMEKQYRKARDAGRSADSEESAESTRAFRTARRNDGESALSRGEYKREKAILDKRLAAIDEQQKADLLAVDLLALQRKNSPAPAGTDPQDSVEAKRLEVLRNAQRARADAYHAMAAQMPLGSTERKKLMEKREEEVLKAGRLKKEHDVACMPGGAEKDREAATIKRHGKFDALKKIFRTPSPYSHEDAAVTLLDGKKLVNAGRATLGGTKAMYLFEDRNDLVDGKPQEWLFKEATNCVGMSKPEGAVVTGEASRLQQYLRGELSIPAQCLKDGDRVLGSIQKRVRKAEGGVDLFKWQAQENLSENAPPQTTMNDLMKEHTLDWVLCNFDTKGENFINQPEGHIISFDKEASFNTLLQEGSRHMSYTFKPHSNDTIYNTMFRAFAKGGIDLDLDANLESIQKMENMQPDEFIDMFRETLDTKYGRGTKNRREAEQLLRGRQQSLRDEYRTFYTQLIRERLGSIDNGTEAGRQERERLEGMLSGNEFAFRDEREQAG